MSGWKEYERVWAEIDLDAIVENAKLLKECSGEQTKLIAVIKADGYGHGAVPIARELETLPELYGFAVATAEEAFVLRGSGIRKPVMILGYAFPSCYERLARRDIHPTVFREDMIGQLSRTAVSSGCTIKVHIKVDTGMGRIGIRPDEEGIQFVRKCLEAPGLEIEGIYTHFARADERDKTSAQKQLALFQDFCGRIEEELGIRIPARHCANSAAILEMPGLKMDAARAGISLYGLWPSEEVERKFPLKPALSLRSKIIFIKEVEAGQEISYGGTFTAPGRMRVATIPVGYADGYPRTLSGCAHVLISGKRAPILGRICMDQFMVDVTELPDVKEGDVVTLIGSEGEEAITMEQLGELSGRFNYELACCLNRRVPRIYTKGGRIVYTRDCFQDYS